MFGTTYIPAFRPHKTLSQMGVGDLAVITKSVGTHGYTDHIILRTPDRVVDLSEPSAFWIADNLDRAQHHIEILPKGSMVKLEVM